MENKNGISIAAMVLGIVAVALCWIWFIAFPCGVLAIIFGCIGNKKSKSKFAKTGFILGIVYMGLLLLITILMFVFIGTSMHLNDGLLERATDARNRAKMQQQLNNRYYYEFLDDNDYYDDYFDDYIYDDDYFFEEDDLEFLIDRPNNVSNIIDIEEEDIYPINNSTNVTNRI